MKMRPATLGDIPAIEALAMDTFAEQGSSPIDWALNAVLRKSIVSGYESRIKINEKSEGLDHSVILLTDDFEAETDVFSGLRGTIELSMQPTTGETAPSMPIPMKRKLQQGEVKPYISNLVVAPRFRRRGFGKKLVEACEAKAVALGFSEVYLHGGMHVYDCGSLLHYA